MIMTKIDITSKKHIIWDWNGTLLNDLDLCLAIINPMLLDRGLKTITKEQYLEIFNFPVRDYYQKLGFDFEKEPFELISTEFITAYEIGRPDCKLFNKSKEVLTFLHKIGITQSILSASKKSYLDKAITDYGIKHLFSAVLGLENHHAAGKVDLAESYMSENHSDPRYVLLIGDTIHDAEIADHLGIQCILIPNGHHSRSRLSETDGVLINSLTELRDLFSRIQSI